MKRASLTSGSCLLASQYFIVHLTTQNNRVVQVLDGVIDVVSDIVFSLHDLGDAEKLNMNDLFWEKPNRSKVYASIIADQYENDDILDVLSKADFDGLTINEEHRAGASFDRDIKVPNHFSLRINKRGSCMDDTFILPNGKITESFRGML